MSVSQPSLPPELEREVFETAFHRRVSPVSMLLLARRVRDWIEPLLYKSLVFMHESPQNEEVADLFRQQTLRSKPQAFFEANVKLVAITSAEHLTKSFVPELLRCCSNVTDLTIWKEVRDLDPDDDGSELIDSILSLRSLKQLALDNEVHSRLFVSALTLRHVEFSDLTHLELNLRRESLSSAELAYFPNLTHMMLSAHLGFVYMKKAKVTVTSALARSRPALKVFVFVVYGWRHAPSKPILNIDDPRLVEETPETFDWRGSLSAHARGLPDHWEHFEAVVDERLARDQGG